MSNLIVEGSLKFYLGMQSPEHSILIDPQWGSGALERAQRESAPVRTETGAAPARGTC